MIFNLGGGAAAPKLMNIAVTIPPTTTKYYADDTFNPSGMEVTAYFDDDSSTIVSDYTYSPTTIDISTTEITISYTQEGVTKNTTVPITVGLYLYNRGNEYSAYSGGIGLGTQDYDGGLKGGAASKNATSIKLSYTSHGGALYHHACCYTQNKVDLTGYTKLVADVKINSINTAERGVKVFVHSQLGGLNTGVGAWWMENLTGGKVGTKATGEQTITYDISSFTGSYYCGVYNHQANTDIYTIRLEK